MKIAYLPICLAFLPIFPLHASITLTQNQIDLEVTRWYDFKDERTGITSSYIRNNHIKPLEFIIKNKSDQPIIISRESLKARCIPRGTLFKNTVSKSQDAFSSAYLGIFFGTCMLALTEAIARKEMRNANRPVPFFYLTPFWAIASWAAVAVYHYHYQDPIINLALDNMLLSDDLIINPGQQVRRVAFFDARAYNGLFSFRVFSQDKKSYAAFFDIELVR